MADSNIYNEFYSIMFEIAYGLKNKELTYKKRISSKAELDKQYVKDQHLMHAINKLYAFAYKNSIRDSNGNILAPSDETDAIINYFSKNISEWSMAQDDEFRNALAPLYEMEPLIQLRADGKYLCNDSCFELAAECVLYDLDAEQRRLFKILKTLSQEAYLYIRKHIILHPVVDSLELTNFKENLKELGVVEQKIGKIIDYAYEPIPDDAIYKCPQCGWTVSKSVDNSLCCIDSRCKHNSDNFKNIEQIGDTRSLKRLKPGVMRYMAIPGKLELEIEDHCLENRIEYELWPEKDAYDIKIYGKNNYIIVVDAKDYKNAFVLSKKILDGGNLFPIDGWDVGYVVVPDEAADYKVDYCKVVDRALKRKVGGNVSCIKLSEFLKKLSEVK